MEVEHSSFVEIFSACVLKRSVRVSDLLCVGEMGRTHEVLNLLPAHPSTAGLEKEGFKRCTTVPLYQGTLYHCIYTVYLYHCYTDTRAKEDRHSGRKEVVKSKMIKL